MSRTITTTQARSNLYRLIEQVSDSHDPVFITGKQHNAVLIAEDDWVAIQETLYLLSVPGMRESIKTGLSASIDECDDEIQW